jgi:hypothetical protein
VISLRSTRRQFGPDPGAHGSVKGQFKGRPSSSSVKGRSRVKGQFKSEGAVQELRGSSRVKGQFKSEGAVQE